MIPKDVVELVPRYEFFNAYTGKVLFSKKCFRTEAEQIVKNLIKTTGNMYETKISDKYIQSVVTKLTLNK